MRTVRQRRGKESWRVANADKNQDVELKMDEREEVCESFKRITMDGLPLMMSSEGRVDCDFM